MAQHGPEATKGRETKIVRPLGSALLIQFSGALLARALYIATKDGNGAEFLASPNFKRPLTKRISVALLQTQP
jgi:hypothetical protein